MPELPEVETLRRMVEPRVIGAKVMSVDIRRADVIQRESGKVMPRNVLSGDVIVSTKRRGKQLALIGQSGRVMVVQLGMTGQLFCESDEQRVLHTHMCTACGELCERMVRGRNCCFEIRADLAASRA